MEVVQGGETHQKLALQKTVENHFSTLAFFEPFICFSVTRHRTEPVEDRNSSLSPSVSASFVCPSNAIL